MVNRFCGVTKVKYWRKKYKKNTESARKYQKPVFSKFKILVMVAQKPII